MKTFSKVALNDIQKGIFDTSFLNYGIINKDSHKREQFLFSLILKIWKNHNINITKIMFLSFILNKKNKNNIIDKFFPNSPVVLNELIKIRKLTKSTNFKFDNSNDLCRFFEYFFEESRKKINPKLPSRLKSYFLFVNKKDAVLYKENLVNKEKYEIFSVNIIEEKENFKADMKWIDMISEEQLYKDAEIIINNYWKQRSTSNPVIEMLIQGKIEIN